ncbi:hypothetical protein BpHYR1_048486, partial [Brachionus plicatilis]
FSRLKISQLKFSRLVFSQLKFSQLVLKKTPITISLLDLILVSNPNQVSEVEVGLPLVSNASRSHCSLQFQIISKTAKKYTFDRIVFNWRKETIIYQ